MTLRNIPCHLLLLLLIASTWALHLPAQSSWNYHEKVVASTDRTLYISGEVVQFSAMVFQTEDSLQGPLSRVLYGEVMSSDGKRVASGKFTIHGKCSSGILPILDETLSGVYFVRFYTRYMRNEPNSSYCIIPIRIVNPIDRKVVEGDVSPQFSDQSNIVHYPKKSEPNKQAYQPRETIDWEFTAPQPPDTNSIYTVSVVPIHSSSQIDLPSLALQEKTPAHFFLPEIRGVSISGRVVTQQKDSAISLNKVNLSIIGDKNIYVTLTDSAGTFYFSLPDYRGDRDLFLSTEEPMGLMPEILIDNDFCSRPLQLPLYRFSLSPEEEKIAYQMAVNKLVSNRFRDKEVHPLDSLITPPYPFYGMPDEVIKTDNYIDLPTLSEYFTELPGTAKLRRVNGKRCFKFLSTQPDMALYTPLMLLDYVAVNDIEKILAVSPQAIDRIELVNAVFMKGGVTYAGIVSFLSKKGDFAGVDLPTSGKFLNYRFITVNESPTEMRETPAHFPDARNTLYWNPRMLITESGHCAIRFSLPDTPGSYVIRIQKLSSSGIQQWESQVP